MRFCQKPEQMSGELKAWKPEGCLSTVMPSSSIAAANKEVKQILDKAESDKPEKNSKRGVYEHLTPVDVVATNDGLYSVGAHQLMQTITILL